MPTRIPFGLRAAPNLGYRRSTRRVSWRDLTAWTRYAISRWRERRMLEMLDERILSDIGISRSQALAEARKPCWRR
jgi:uncharacterized protein YjiS (DUF1127 family)